MLKRGNSGRRSPSLVAQVLASVSELMEEVGAFPRSSEEVFLLVRDLAHSCDVIRKHLLASEVAARLAIFVMRDHSPPEVRRCGDVVCVYVLMYVCVGVLSDLGAIWVPETGSFILTVFAAHTHSRGFYISIALVYKAGR